MSFRTVASSAETQSWYTPFKNALHRAMEISGRYCISLNTAFSLQCRVAIALTDSDADRAIGAHLRRRVFGFPVWMAAGVLSLPDDPMAYCRGRHRQALRTNRNHANALGMRVRRVTALEFALLSTQAQCSQHKLANLADLIREPLHPDMETWVGETAEGEVIAFARFSIGSNCAFMKYFVAVPDPKLSIIRWKMSADIFENFIERKIIHLVSGSLMDCSNGLRYFQDRLGFTNAIISIKNKIEYKPLQSVAV